MTPWQVFGYGLAVAVSFGAVMAVLMFVPGVVMRLAGACT
jgi:hypothetical protein